MSYLEDRMKRKTGLLPKLPTKKERKPLKKISDKKQAAIADTDNLDLWYEERRKEMTGKCFICGGKTEKDNDDTYRNSIHHLFDKRKNMFPSVCCHPDNWIEVCFWGNSCHTNIHNGKITWELLLDSKEGEVIIEKFKKIYPFIDPKEHKNIPDILLQQL